METDDDTPYDLRPLAELLLTSESTAGAAAAALTTRGDPIMSLSQPGDCAP